MELTQNVIIIFVIAAAVIAVVVLVVGRGRRSTKTTMGSRGVEFETRNEEEGAQTTTIKDVKITKSNRTTVESEGQGAHIGGIEVGESDDTSLKAKKEK